MTAPLDPPRFRRRELNPRLCPGGEGDSFQSFVAEIFESEYPGLHAFPGGGKDGCIDLVWPPDGTKTVFECKTIGEDGLDAARPVWQEVARKLAKYLSAPTGPPAGQVQYQPWYRTDPPIAEFVFCLSSLLANERQRQDLRDEIQRFFTDLASRHFHLRHLSNLRVSVRDWEDLRSRLAAQPHLLFRWFPNARPPGLVPLGEEPTGTRFSEYLTSAQLPYYARQMHLALHPAPPNREIPDEVGLLASFEAQKVHGLVITGGGGFGKTRLMLQLGHLANEAGWAVFRVQGRLKTAALEVLADHLRPGTPALVLVDYIETQSSYSEWVEELSVLAEERGLPLQYIACCRTSFYSSIQGVGRHFRVDLFPQSLDPEMDRWLEHFRDSTVRHIVERTSLPFPEEIIERSRAIPVLAVFAAWLHANNRNADLEELLSEPDFGTWVHNRVRKSFPERPVAGELAQLVALFPLSESAVESLSNVQAVLLDRLALDGWIDKVNQEGETGARWEVVHDVLADQVLLSYIATIPATRSRFVRELFEEAARLGCVDSALTALQRIGGNSALLGLPWADLIGEAMDLHPRAWRTTRIATLRSPLLDLTSQIGLLRRSEDIWIEAEKDPNFQGLLGWLTRAVMEEDVVEPGTRETLVQWVRRSVPHVAAVNFLLTQGIRLDPAGTYEAALRWLRNRPSLFQTHYLIRVWLLEGLPTLEVWDVVSTWLSRFRRTAHSSFVLKSWLDAGGDKDLVRNYVSAFLDEHEKLPDAQFVFKAWLDAGGEKDLVRSHVSAWLAKHEKLPAAGFVLTAWLDAGGEKDLVRSHVSAWLAEYEKLPDAGFVLTAWLDAGGEKDLVKDHVSAWLAEHKKSPDAQFVLKIWLEVEGDKNLIKEHLLAWLEAHGTSLDAGFLLSFWLEVNGPFETVRDFSLQWLGEHHQEHEAIFLTTYLVRQKDLPVETVRDILAWCRAFCRDPEALWRLSNLVRSRALSSEIAQELAATSEAVVGSFLEEDNPALDRRALLAVLFANLSRYASVRRILRPLFIRWLQHPVSLAPLPLGSHNFPAKLLEISESRDLIFYITGAIAEGAMDLGRDRQHLSRFFDWVATWRPQNQRALRLVLEAGARVYAPPALAPDTDTSPPR